MKVVSTAVDLYWVMGTSAGKLEKQGHRTRGEITRENILAAARARFAADGYERATIRLIAADAAIDPALVMRYFGNKESLFAEAAEFDLALPAMKDTPLREAGAALAGHFFDRWENDAGLQALLRASTGNEAAAQKMRAIFGRQVRPAIAALTGDRAAAGLRAALVSTQLLGFGFARYVLRLPAVAGLSRSQACAWMGPTLQRYLTQELPSGSRPLDP
jgi:AcrR family transcriptional regulator